MPDGTKNSLSQTGELKKVEKEPRLERESKRPNTVPEVDIPNGIGSTTGVMHIHREEDDESSQGDEDNPL